nr:Toll/interleukin-1 receptor (TIR) domain-containing protein [Tanacetum cinerariifolium]
METRVKDVVSSLELGTDEVRIIGIKGMGGAGKTTTTRAVFDNISNDFEAKSFVENVREVSNGAGLKKLQEQVLLKVLNEHEAGKKAGCSDGKGRRYDKGGIVAIVEGEAHGALCLRGGPMGVEAQSHIAEFIKKIVGEISLELRSINFGFDEKLVGMETRVKDVVSSLELGTDEVHIIGIKGMGGAEKTTTARAVFDNISNDFEAKSFVEKVREVSNGAGLKKLHEQVLLKVLNEHVTLDSVNDGKNMMKERMRGVNANVVMKGLGKMKKLRYLKVDFSYCGKWESDGESFDSDLKLQYFLNSLKYLKCFYYPLLHLPKTFQANNLVGLEMHNGRMVQLWEEGDDAPIKGRSINEGDVAAERISNDSEEIARVLTSMDAATVLAGVLNNEYPKIQYPNTKISHESNTQTQIITTRTMI